LAGINIVDNQTDDDEIESQFLQVKNFVAVRFSKLEKKLQ
jgi:hypothetical protein